MMPKMLRMGMFLMLLFGLGTMAFPQPKVESELLEVVVLKDTQLQKVIRDIDLGEESWDLLPEIRFWRKVMRLDPDFCILNNARTREIYQIFPTILYDSLPDKQKPIFKDSLIQHLGLPKLTPLYVTYGKRDYYQFDRILADISKGIKYFDDEKVDPWYAQTILLIESPGFSRTSHTGAKGRFQLMRGVAIQQGLKVNSKLDEREDLEKSARAAASYLRRVCIPQAEKLLRARRHEVDKESLHFRLLVMHIYHAGAGNVSGALRKIPSSYKGMALIQKLWHTSYRGFRNASQNYSQIAVAALLELNEIVKEQCDVLCLGK